MRNDDLDQTERLSRWQAEQRGIVRMFAAEQPGDLSAPTRSAGLRALAALAMHFDAIITKPMPHPSILDRWRLATGVAKTRLLRAHAAELREEARRRYPAGG